MKSKGISLKSIIVILSVLMVAVPVVIFGFIELKVMAKRASEDAENIVASDVMLVQKSIKTVFDGIQTEIKSDITLAEYILESAGKPYLDNTKSVKINAVNQVTKESNEIEIPVMIAGGDQVAFNYRLVDDIQAHVGGRRQYFRLSPMDC